MAATHGIRAGKAFVELGVSDKLTAGLRHAQRRLRVASLTIGAIIGIAKKGWEYLWVRYADGEDATAKALVKRPVAAYVEKVYEEGDFTTLGIG